MSYKHVIVIETEEQIEDFEHSMAPTLDAMFRAQVKGQVFIASHINQLGYFPHDLRVPNPNSEKHTYTKKEM